jgi:hypothetical protein
MVLRSATEVEVCYLYVPEDRDLVGELDKHLAVIRRQMLVSFWGVDQELYDFFLDMHLDSASIILVFISSDFLRSDYCNGPIMQRVIQRHGVGEVRVILISLRPATLEGTPIGTLQAEVLPHNEKPVTSWENQDAAFVDIATSMKNVLSIISDRKLQASLGMDFQVRQQAISRVARADPGNIQEVAASQLSIINSYYQSGLQQSQQSFHWSLVCS